MACNLTGGRKKPCKDAVGGIKKVYFVDFGGFGTITTSNDEITDMDGTFSFHQYDVKGNSSLETTINSSLENGTTFFEQVLNITLHKLTKEDNKELKLLSFGRPHVMVQTYDDKFMVVGLVNGAEVTGGTMVTGTALGDMQGYTLTLTAQETTPPNFINGATLSNPFAGMGSATASGSTQRTP
jgi:hypothetical protein